MKILRTDVPTKIYFKPYGKLFAPRGTKADFRLYAEYLKEGGECSGGICDTYETDITNEAQYDYYNEVVTIENGTISYSGLGITYVTAAYKGKSAELEVEFINQDSPVEIFFKPNLLYIRNNQTREVRLYGKYYNKDKKCNPKFENTYDCAFRYEDVTDKASYETKVYIGNEYDIRDDIIKYQNGKVSLVNPPGNKALGSIVTFSLGQFAYMPVYLLGDRLMMLKVKGPRSNDMPECPVSGCYVTNTSKTLNMMVLANTEAFSYDEEITDSVTWEISDPSVATIDSAGVLTPKKAGVISIRAHYSEARSDKTWIYITDKNKDDFLVAGIGNNKKTLPLLKGEKMNIYSAIYSYSLTGEDATVALKEYVSAEGISIDDASRVTSETLNNCVNGKACYVLTGAEPGFVNVSTTYRGLRSNSVDFEVWRYEEQDWCDEAKPNEISWSDYYGAVAKLDTDCASYGANDPVKVRYTAQVPGGNEMYLDSCLDMWILDEKDNVVKTFRNEGCSSEDIGRHSSKTVETVFQTAYEWDKRDDGGVRVAPGKYYLTARFYIYYEPVIHLPFEIK